MENSLDDDAREFSIPYLKAQRKVVFEKEESLVLVAVKDKKL